jgi:phosphatidylglycerophosphate synthase
MFDKQLRHTKDRLLNPLADTLADVFDKRVHPTAVTLAGGGAGLLAAVAGAQGAALAGLALNRLLDGLDGTLARRHQRVSDFGGYVDILTDHVVYAAIPVGLVLAQPAGALWLSLAFMLSAFYINGASWLMLSSILEKRRQRQADEVTTIVMPAGLIEGAETVFFYGLFFLLPGLLLELYVVFGALVLLTVGQRLVWAWQHLD